MKKTESLVCDLDFIVTKETTKNEQIKKNRVQEITREMENEEDTVQHSNDLYTDNIDDDDDETGPTTPIIIRNTNGMELTFEYVFFIFTLWVSISHY